MSIRVYDPSLSFLDRVSSAVSHPVTALEGAIWSVILISDGKDFFADLSDRIYKPKNGQEKSQSTFEVTKKFLYLSHSFVGTLANFVVYLHRTGIIFLGRFTPIVSGIAYFSRIYVSRSNSWDAIDKFNYCANEVRHAPDAAKRAHAHRRQHLALLKLTAQVTTVAWAVLGLVSLAVAVPALAVAYDVFFLASIASAVAELAYRGHLKKAKLLAAPTVSSMVEEFTAQSPVPERKRVKKVIK